MRIAIIGTKGIPDHYGGFEHCTEYLAGALVKRGYEVIVYNAHNHPYQEKTWNAVNIHHCYDPTAKIGSAGRLLYAYNCIKDLRKNKFDAVLQFGHASNYLWGWLLPGNAVVTTYINKPTYSGSVVAALLNPIVRLAEKLTIRHSNFLITNSVETQEYLNHTYGKESRLIPYGTKVLEQPDATVLDEFKVESGLYDLLISKIIPENDIEMILDGVVKANTDRLFLVAGDTDTSYGTYLIGKFNRFSNIMFCGEIANRGKLDNLRYHSNLYFHTCTANDNHTGLFDAMATGSLICSKANSADREILGNDALYFSTTADVARYLTTVHKKESDYTLLVANNQQKITDFYSCESTINAFMDHFGSIMPKRVKIYKPKARKAGVSLLLKNS